MTQIFRKIIIVKSKYHLNITTFCVHTVYQCDIYVFPKNVCIPTYINIELKYTPKSKIQ